MANRSIKPILAVLATLFALAGSVRSQPQKDEKSLAETFRVFAKREAASYTIRLDGSDRPLTLRPEPVLTWSNPVMGTIYGNVFLWTADGRPEAVASIYRFYRPDPHRADEFHSLAFGRLVAKRDGVATWTPSRRGLDLKPIPGTRLRPPRRPRGFARCVPSPRNSPAARPAVPEWTPRCAC